MVAAERETTISYTADMSHVNVFTCISKDINAFRRRGLTPVKSGVYKDGTPWAFFEIPIDRFNAGMSYRPGRKKQIANG